MSALPAYEYTSLGSLPESGRVNVYGVVRNVTALDNGGFVVKVEVGFYRNERALVVEVGSFGCHAVSWRGDFDAPLQLTSSTCTVSKQDSVRVLGVYRAKGDAFTVFLRVWDGTKPRFAAYRNMFHAGSDSIETAYCEIQQFLLHVIEDYVIDVCCYGDWARKAMGLKANSVGDIVFLGNIRNYVCHSNKLSAVTLHDGGARFNRALNVVNESDELTPLFSEEPQARSTPKASPNPVNVVKGKEIALVDVSLQLLQGFYMNASLGQSLFMVVVCFEHDDVRQSFLEFLKAFPSVNAGCNAAANISFSRNTSVINSELRGKSATPVATESSPRKRRRRSIVEGERVTAEEVAVTGEFSEWLDARQGPSRAEANTTQPQMLPRNSSSSSDLAGISSPCIAQTEDQIRNQVLNSEEDSIVDGETVIVDQHLEEICGNSVFSLEILRFLDDLVRRNLPKSDEVLRIAAFHNKIKQKLLETLFEKKLAELDGTETGGIELVEEMEEILKMNVGDHVDFVK
ncbi:unnamed protein product [Angiostrongylus costaricensis]|uniref:POT1PC domain-containing protein n=1 Tax=Angiostrongylus costaricensis TaxID=334426 RepID=A0A0R3Q2C2_ANGCS|nr:unnamed protein product [Angiostrongylus costaricensis]